MTNEHLNTGATPNGATLPARWAAALGALCVAALAIYLSGAGLAGQIADLRLLQPDGSGPAAAGPLLQGLVSLAWLAALLLGWLGLGWPAVRRVPGLDRTGRIALSLPLGAGLSSLALFGLGLAQLWSFGPLMIWAALTAVAGLYAAYRERGAARDRQAWSAGQVGLVALLALLLLPALLRCQLPPTARDALIYQLYFPRLYLEANGIYALPFMRSYYPMAVNMLFGQGLALDSDRLPALIHLALFGCTLLLVGWGASQGRDRSAGLWAALAYAGLPVCLHLAGVAYIDHGLALFAIAALLLAWHATKRDSLWGLALAGALAGCGLWTKFNGLHLMLGLCLALAALDLRLRLPWRKAVLGLALLLLAAGLVNVPGMLRNVLLKGNPLWPLLPGIFGGEPYQPGVEQIPEQQWEYFTLGVGQWYRLLAPLLLPLSATTPVRAEVDGPLGPLPLLGALLALPLLLRRRQGDGRGLAIAVYAAALVLLFVATSRLRARYLIAALPPLAVLAGMALAREAPWPGRAVALLTRLVMLVAVLAGGLWAWAELARGRPLDYLLGRESREQYLEQRLDRYPVWAWINANLPPEAKLYYMYFGAEGYYCERALLCDELVYDYTVRELARRTADTPELIAALRGLGVTHLVVDYEYFRRAVEDRGIMDQAEADRLSDLLRALPVLYLHENYGVQALPQDAP